MMSSEKNKPIRVAMIVDKLPPIGIGGAEIQALKLARELTKFGVYVAFLTPGRDQIKGYAVIDGLPVYRLHSFANYFWDFFSALRKKAVATEPVKIEYDDRVERTDQVTTPIGIGVKLRYLFFYINALFFFRKRSRDFDIIHVHSMEWPSFVGAWLSLRFRFKLIIKDATMNGIHGLSRYPQGKNKLITVINCATFVAMTRSIRKNFLLAGVPEKKIVTIPNGIEITDIPDKNYRPVNRRVIFVGNLSQQPAKGIDILLKAWKKVKELYKDAHLSIVGDGSTTAYELYVNEHGLNGSISILGKRADVKELLLDSDIFVLPSRREGMPNALMEAMLLGLPCIGTDISGSQDLIEHGVTGLLVPPANVEKLSESLCFMMERSQESIKMGRMAKRKIVEKYNMPLIAEQYVDLYKKTLTK